MKLDLLKIFVQKKFQRNLRYCKLILLRFLYAINFKESDEFLRIYMSHRCQKCFSL